MSKRKVTVAGAGVMGSCLAVELAAAGLQVTVMDAGLGRSSTSAISGGMLSPVLEAFTDPLAREHLGLLLAGRDLWPDLAKVCGVQLYRRGALASGPSDWLRDLARFGRDAGLDLVAEAGGIRIADDWLLDPVAALQGLQAGARDLGARFVARDWTPAHRDEPGDVVIWAGGFGETAGLPELAVLTPIRGHILRYRSADGAGRTPAILRGPQGYCCSLGAVQLGGATMEPGMTGREADPDIALALHQRLCTLDPDLAGLAWTAHAGIRAATPDGLPLVGLSRQAGAWIATGLRRNGWLLAPLVARIVTAQLLERDPGPWAGSLASSRFPD